MRRLDIIKLTIKIKQKKDLVDFAVPADHRVNMKESKKIDKYLDLAKELKNL